MTMLLDLKHNAAYFVAVIVSVLVAALAVTDFVTTGKYSPYLTLEALMRKNASVSERAVEGYANRLAIVPETCRSDILNASIAVAMRDIDQKMALPDRTAWIAALRSMEPLLRDGLTCMPTNGMLWNQLAIVRWLLGGTVQEQATLLAMSQAYAPAEIQVLRNRFVQWRRVTPYVIDLADHTLRSDIRMVLNYGPAPFVKEILASLTPLLTPIMADEAASLSQERRNELAKEDVVLPANK